MPAGEGGGCDQRLYGDQSPWGSHEATAPASLALGRAGSAGQNRIDSDSVAEAIVHVDLIQRWRYSAAAASRFRSARSLSKSGMPITSAERPFCSTSARPRRADCPSLNS